MFCTLLGLIAFAVLLGSASASPCPTVRVGYTDQARPPFFLGRGPSVPEPSGMVVDLIRKSFAEEHCPVTLTRLPPARLLVALTNGEVDFSFIGMNEKMLGRITYPTLPDGTMDRSRALHIKGVLYVRQVDGARAAASPRRFFRSHTLAAYRQFGLFDSGAVIDGLKIDFGAVDIWANLEKLRLGRVDGVLTGLFDESSLDEMVVGRYGDSITRLPTPLIFADLTLAASNEFYRNNPKLVRALWERIRDRWPSELRGMVKLSAREADEGEFFDE